MEELCFLTVSELSKRIKNREVSPVEVVKALLDRIDQVDGRINAYITVARDQAFQEAREAEEAILRGQYLGPLHGIPIALKDNFATKGVRTTAGSKILRDWIPAENATAFDRLKKAGTVLLGKLNMHEFAWGATTNNPHYGPTRNPWDTDRIPGGSSGGSGAALAASLCPASLGSDTGGSIRIPSCVCGTVGLKPTYGRVSRAGVVTLSWSLDQAGPMARSVEDVALLLRAIAGRDVKDPTSADVAVPDYVSKLKAGVKGLRIGIPTEEYAYRGIDGDIATAVQKAVTLLEGLGAVTQEVTIPHIKYAAEAWLLIASAEASEYHRQYLRGRAEEYGADVRERLEWGNLVMATDYVRAQRVKTLVRQEFLQALGQVDVIITPTLAATAPKIGENTVLVNGREENFAPYFGRFTRPLSLVGLPVISIPCGFTSTNLPIGMQVIGKPFAENTILTVARAYEDQTEWHRRRPSL